MKRPAVWLVGFLAAVGVVALLATSAGSSDPGVRDGQGRPLAPGREIAQLMRGADGLCRPAPGTEPGVSGRARPGESGSVTLSVDQATCKLVVSKVNTQRSSDDPPTETVEGGGQR